MMGALAGCGGGAGAVQHSQDGTTRTKTFAEGIGLNDKEISDFEEDVEGDGWR